MTPLSHHTSSLVVATAAAPVTPVAAALSSVRPSGRHSWLLNAASQKAPSAEDRLSLGERRARIGRPNHRQPFLPMRDCRAARLSHPGPGRTYARAAA